MKLGKILFAIFVMSIMFLAVPASVHAEDDDESGSGNSENEYENNNDNDDDNEQENDNDNDNDNDTNSDNDNEQENDDENEIEYEEEYEVEYEEEYVEEVVVEEVVAEANIVPTQAQGYLNAEGVMSYAQVTTEDLFFAKNENGMEVRLLQLQKSVVKQITTANLIVDEIYTQNISVDTTILEEKIYVLETLNNKITLDLSNSPINVSVIEFVDMKNVAIVATFEFKKELYNILTPEQLNSIKQAINEKLSTQKDDDYDEVDKKLKEKIEEFNKKKIHELAKEFKLNNTELISKLDSGNITSKELAEFKKEFKKDFNELNKEMRKEFSEKMKEEREKNINETGELNAKMLGLKKEDVANILQDESLTWDEKQAKIRVLAKDRNKERNETFAKNLNDLNDRKRR
jgi:hypothetical protein